LSGFDLAANNEARVTNTVRIILAKGIGWTVAIINTCLIDGISRLGKKNCDDNKINNF